LLFCLFVCLFISFWSNSLFSNLEVGNLRKRLELIQEAESISFPSQDDFSQKLEQFSNKQFEFIGNMFKEIVQLVINTSTIKRISMNKETVRVSFFPIPIDFLASI
jgi:hypothetical protein